MTIPLSTAHRSLLRSTAHRLKPVVLIGDAGLTPAVLKEIEHSLQAHELIKVRVSGDERDVRLTISTSICNTLGAVCVQQIGKMLVFYQPQPKLSDALSVNHTHDKNAKNTRLANKSRMSAGMKAGKSPSKFRTVKKSSLKYNERLTSGGLIKRAKVRQASLKKLQLNNP